MMGAFSAEAFSKAAFSEAAFDFGALQIEPTRPSVGSPRDRTFIPYRKDALAEMRQRDDAEIVEIVNILFATGVFDGK
jgi:hypothetical protein